MTLLITGGTGSFGKAYLKAVPKDVDVLILSRDEEKQRKMALRFPHVRYVIGDVRDRDAVRQAMRGVTQVFHAAALKQVPQSEANPGETLRTNVLGTENVCLAAQEVGAKVVVLSTDKAVEPVGVMGATKMLAERTAVHYGYNVVRYGNVVGSRGSIVPLFRDLISRCEPLTVTEPGMTRFLITLDEAIGLVTTAMDAPMDGSIFARKSPAATVAQLVRVMVPPDYAVKIIGTRPGEKWHEHLVLPHEAAVDCGTYFRIDRYGQRAGIAYSSEVAPRLSDDELAAMIDGAPTDDL
jgi:UDP-N-acetylglucosamine 4,6-dehydratase